MTLYAKKRKKKKKTKKTKKKKLGGTEMKAYIETVKRLHIAKYTGTYSVLEIKGACGLEFRRLLRSGLRSYRVEGNSFGRDWSKRGGRGRKEVLSAGSFSEHLLVIKPKEIVTRKKSTKLFTQSVE